MGTSNWQNISFCVDALMKIEPRRVLDIGVGFGRWGILTREFCEVWYQRVTPPEWIVQIEGIEGFEANIADYHRHFYNKIHTGDARDVIPTLPAGWDVVVFGDVLEHFEHAEGERLLTWALDHSTYVIVNIPLGSEWPQEETYENPFERHMSEWEATDFVRFAVRRQEIFRDFKDRIFGSFILSRADPKNLAVSLFSRSSAVDALPDDDAGSSLGLDPADELLLERVRQTQRELNEVRTEIAVIKASRSYRVTQRLLHSGAGPILVRAARRLLPDEGGVLRAIANRDPRTFARSIGARVGRAVHLPRYARVTPAGAHSPELDPPRVSWRAPAPSVDGNDRTVEPAIPDARAATTSRFSEEEQAWLEEMSAEKPAAIAVMHPEWLGVRRSTVELFPHHHCFIDDNVTEAEGIRKAKLLLETGCERIVLGGFPRSYIHLVRALHRLNPRRRLFSLWYGSFLQHAEDYAWHGFRTIDDLCRSGVIYKWGFAKKGMAEIMATTGVRTGFVMSLVRHVPITASTPRDGGPHVGVWVAQPTWRKIPYAMVAALRVVPGAQLHGSSIDTRTVEFARMLGLTTNVSSGAIPLERMPEMLAGMHLNLYVTLSECAPMVPLESLAVGVPCLLGPSSHFFEDHEYLHRRLVVPYPDRALTIAQHILAALEERAAIVEAYRAYAPAYNARALACLEEFLEVRPDAADAVEYA